MIGLALSGGGSRAMAFHLGCMRALHDLGILEQVSVLSTISGGSVIGAYYAYNPKKTFEEFEDDIREFLRSGFHRSIIIELLKPNNLLLGTTACFLSHIQDATSLISSKEPPISRFRSRTGAFESVLNRKLFKELKLDSLQRRNLEVVIGACELRTGTAFRFGNSRSGTWRHGEIENNNIPISFAVASSAAYPIFLPAFDKTFCFKKHDKMKTQRVLLTDGGVYDNLGIQVLEPGRNPEVSLHTFPCDYIISCNAGQGQESSTSVPLGFFSRVTRSFEVIHRRVQNNAMHHLHKLKEAGLIRGFAMPYLGQQEAMLPNLPPELVPREQVINYPTNFAAMSDHWINTLSNRGEQLTRILVPHYLPSLLE
jgi:NTE family protein